MFPFKSFAASLGTARAIRASLVLAVLLPASSVQACNLPVFRYALERWNKRNVDDLYSLYVFYDASIPKDLGTALLDLEEKLEDLPALANLFLYRVNVSKPIRDEAIAKIYEKEKAGRDLKGKTWMVLRFPETWALEAPLYSGPFDPRMVDSLLHSPMRKKIARAILQGHSAVFLFLECGDKEKDQKSFTLASDQLGLLEKEIKLPERGDDPKDRLLREDIPLKVSFVLHRLSVKDTEEIRLLEMLKGMDPMNEWTHGKEPVLLPIYGRGIAMGDQSLIGKGINAENITGIARFLTGRCSCEVRRLNPGIDLLMAIDWDGPPPK